MRQTVDGHRRAPASLPLALQGIARVRLSMQREWEGRMSGEQRTLRSFAEALLATGSRIVAEGGKHAPTAVVLMPEGWTPPEAAKGMLGPGLGLYQFAEFGDERSKRTVRMLFVAAAALGAEKVAFVTEAWTVTGPRDEVEAKRDAAGGSLERVPGRGESLIVMAADPAARLILERRILREGGAVRVGEPTIGEGGEWTDRFVTGWPPSTTARYVSSCPSDPTSRWTPCPPVSGVVAPGPPWLYPAFAFVPV